jgi:RNase P subunit RPR2
MNRFAKAVFNWLFGCHHRHLSRVMTIDHQMIVVCLTCGTRIRYSWDTMSIVGKIPEPIITVSVASRPVKNGRRVAGQLLPQ